MKPCARPPQPFFWLFTEETAQPDAASVLAAVARLPPASGIVFRHHGWPRARRLALLAALRPVARRAGHRLLVARPPGPLQPGEGEHRGRWASARRRPRPASLAVHTLAEALAARRAGVRLVFVSPVHPTPSHPGARPLGRFGFARLARAAGGCAVALGGMTPARAKRLRPLGGAGMAAVSYWGSRSSTAFSSAESSQPRSTSPKRATTSPCDGTT